MFFMRTRLFAAALCLAAGLLAAIPAEAQYGAKRRPGSNVATGEDYHVEVAGTLWNPTPSIVISSESLGILGDNVDFVTTLGLPKSTFKQLKVVLRPGTKHKFRIEYTPIKYDGQKVIDTSFVFNGQRYTIGLPVTSELLWKAYRFGYEFDFVYKDRGFVGLLLETKYTDVTATLTATLAGISRTEFTHARGPIPAIGVIARGYVLPNISITGEFSGFPEIGATGSSRYGGKYYDFDLYGTVNFSDHLGAQTGYRSFDVFYKVNKDSGTLTLKGLYFGGVARF
jgi:hypothetical protein